MPANKKNKQKKKAKQKNEKNKITVVEYTELFKLQGYDFDVYTDRSPFEGKEHNGRPYLPFLCGIDIEKGEGEWDKLIEPGDPQQWNEDQKTKDFVDFAINLLSQQYVKDRVFMELEAESKIMAHITSTGSDVKLKLTVKSSIGQFTALENASTFFGGTKGAKKELVFGSYSLGACFHEFVYYQPNKGIYKKEADKQMEERERKKSVTIIVLIKHILEVYGRVHSKQKNQTEKQLTSKLDGMVRVLQLIQGAMWGWDGKDTYSIQEGSAAFQQNRHIDKNYVDKTKGYTDVVTGKGLIANDIVSNLSKKIKESPQFIVDEAWKRVGFKQVPFLKSILKKQAEKTSTFNIMNPVILNEKDFRSVVADMVGVVFNKQHWDDVKITSKEGDRDRLATALCLLQLGIGSRARGILGANQIEILDSFTRVDEISSSLEETRQALFDGISNTSTLRVKRITKERGRDAQIEKERDNAKYFGYNENMTVDEAQDIVDRRAEAKVIDKPFQYYLFDPMTHGRDIAKGKRITDFYKSKDHTKQNPRRIYMILFQQCRQALRTMCKSENNKTQWERYETDGLNIDMWKEEQKHPMDLHTFYKKAYTIMVSACRKYLGRLPGMKSVSTHELRRMYACYSYEYFGRGKVKEIGYAQYVFRHKSINTSIRYTTLQFNMMVDTRVAPEMVLNDEYVSTLIVLDKQISSLKRKLGDLEELMEASEMTGKKQRKSQVSLKNEKGETVLVDRKPKDKRGSGKNSRIQNGLTTANRIDEMGIPVTLANLVSVGVGTDIVKDVLSMFLDKP